VSEIVDGQEAVEFHDYCVSKSKTPAISYTSPEGVALLIAGETEILWGLTYIASGRARGQRGGATTRGLINPDLLVQRNLPRNRQTEGAL
jgi:hypothetical protein